MLRDKITVIETNIDDLLPLGYENLIDKLFEKGALDVYITPVQMKKSRPAALVTVLCKNSFKDKLASVIFEETPTFGVRFYQVTRCKLARRTETVRTEYGPVRVKLGSAGGKIKTVSPEYEDCKKLARDFKVPLRRVYEQAKYQFQSRIRGKRSSRKNARK